MVAIKTAVSSDLPLKSYRLILEMLVIFKTQILYAIVLQIDTLISIIETSLSCETTYKAEKYWCFTLGELYSQTLI